MSALCCLIMAADRTGRKIWGLERVCVSAIEATAPSSCLSSFAPSQQSQSMIAGYGLTPTKSLNKQLQTKQGSSFFWIALFCLLGLLLATLMH